MTSGARDGITSRLTRGLFALGVLTLAVGVVVGAVAPGASLPLSDGTESGDTVRQVDPATAGDEGDLSPVERRLAGQVLDRVRSGALNLSAAERENAVSSLNDSRFEGLLSRYRGVSNRTGNQNTSRLVIQLQRTQQRYTVQFDRYWDLHGTYENLTGASVGAGSEGATLTPAPGGFATPSARLSPDGPDDGENRTRRIAREMERTWLQLNQTGRRLVSAYRATGNVTTTSYAEVIQSVRASLTNVSRTQAEVRREAFVRTRFDELAIGSTAISFTDPLQVAGRLVTETGDPIENRTLNVTVGNRTLPVRLDTAGRFDLTYRPTVLRTNTSELTLEFQPPNESIYLGSRTTVDVSISQVTPTVSVSASPDGVGYGENLTVSGRVVADGMGVPEVPYIVTLGDRFVAVNETGADGGFERSVSVPADVPAGTTRVGVRVATSEQAIANASGSATVRLSQTDTSIDLSATLQAGREVRVTGRLGLPDGRPVVGERVTISADGQVLATLETGTDGSYDGVVLVPADLAGGEAPVTVAATLTAEGSNLGRSAAEAQVRVAGASGSILPVVLGLGLLVAIGGLLAWARPWRGLRGFGWGAGRSATAAGDDSGWADDGIPPAGADGTAATLLDRARERYEAGDHGEAVQLGYAALRSRLSPAVDGAGSRTHWEFYQACRRGRLEEGPVRTLRQVTEAYERIRFAAETASEETAREVLEAVGGLEGGGTAADRPQGGGDD